ncbi:MAG: bifunctional (p)ppGpp synthetase/guanosine-3',5'-bis(diphosphate) 3'-pyrophosphohydrolase [Candidatus Hydrogenedentes bacterium]|nr:bifunctional (p)ppGpp synthetase/guanosine-3',5'-bis(diphosphate) 3'-pyrophosphohydrolase [Candidatus Hydrogenedentota bacterium]
MRTEFAKLLKQLRKNHPGANLDIVRKAYRVANDAHHGVNRASGDPYVSHCIAVARILSQLNLDPVTIAAGLLHDVLEDTRVTHDELKKEFGEEITSLVDGVSKIKTMKLSNAKPSQKEKQADNLRKMLVATARDVRVILIKLADRLHNMRTIEFLKNPDQVRRISQETLDIYAPLAHRLGIAQWKWELEDHAFHQLNPVEYKNIATQVAMKRHERESWLNDTIEYLENRLSEAEVNARVIGRPKHLYSIHRKMVQQGKDFDQVLDVLALRIITQTESECYNALGVVHALWPPVPGRFKDYVAMPKANMYQSIHTVVMRENGRALEIQIRTEDMDRTAREGIAAHWQYKEGTRDTKLDKQLNWLRQMYEWLQETHGPDEFLDTIRRDVGRSDIYVFTPKGEVRELPEGATPLDFAYHIHSDIGHHCIGARVNGRLVPLRYNLQTGDVVEILTSKAQTPHLDWLEVVVMGKARTRIRQRLRELGELEPLEGQIKRDTIRVLPETRPRIIKQVDDATRDKLIRVEGAKGISVNFAKCCKPMPGHAVIGYITKMPGITVHRADCRNFANTKRDSNRIVEASWQGEEHVEIGMRVTTGQRPNMLADITNAIRPMNISITRAQYHPSENGKSYFEFVFEAPDQDSIARVASTIRTVPGVADVSRMPVEFMSRT